MNRKKQRKVEEHVVRTLAAMNVLRTAISAGEIESIKVAFNALVHDFRGVVAELRPDGGRDAN